MQIWQIAVLIVGLFILAGLAWFFLDSYRRRRLQSRFGPEYQRTVSEIGDRRRAETELSRREQRLRRLDIRPLTAADRTRFETQWDAIQSHFVDDPAGTATEADRLILEMMRARGYPTDDANERIENMSAAYPHIAGRYRDACGILDRYRAGMSSTEDLRLAMVHYKDLFFELTGGRHEELEREEFKRAS